jgi:hypothetical protein
MLSFDCTYVCKYMLFLSTTMYVHVRMYTSIFTERSLLRTSSYKNNVQQSKVLNEIPRIGLSLVSYTEFGFHFSSDRFSGFRPDHKKSYNCLSVSTIEI